ncbi:TPA: type II toxin-antitoxin system HipA family toxin [Vibrio vulnificus]|uniref:Type II toxin-antitoxin system HipA family toxin n=1 Tax=Vibrio vulnificus TaxID=672 RepID=A0A8H9K655_VIBVL|nr:type II toxin-antitoxin system HipA family toxin [Vibrio vulnificus]EHU4943547.1 type II toxin-antitoxin system HipA family toxin [Vibrio vulnificus]ELB7528403.1 type II toxin-antitoxin system HipA family toxin [Vibrio vulnificus]ELK2276715.1 type II toxin-antitoxin system HipA family toxin [Vibrio vulnificus]MCG6277987.1 type II toxin-antitoxin system HipA family toxin [Vibrio vulnificus]MCU8511333.1 type II toxin-antitoxin system HipA family toxin [Vibrio vulnificus]
MVMEVITITYQDDLVGAVSFDTEKGLGSFEYDPSFVKKGVELSPIKMPLSNRIYRFPELDFNTFKGLPGLIADSLPDDFGNAVLNAWVASQGRSPSDITPLQRLQYTGKRGMGALEYAPATKLRSLNASQQVEIQSLVSIAQEILDSRGNFEVELKQNGQDDREAMMSLLSVGMSAGGARPKAVLAFNEDFTQVRSGQTNVPSGFTHYLMKFDGVSEHNKNQETFGDPLGYGAMEFVYHLMATKCGVDMMPCRLLHEGNRRHFITQRFDRIKNSKVHVQTLNGLAHIDYKKPGSFSYAELFGIARQLKLSAVDAEQLFKRMTFNIIARNHDDHSKNFAFMLKQDRLKKDKWTLAPAYDLAYSYKPGSKWVNSHWMSLNGKRDNFTRSDFYSLEKLSPIFNKRKIDDIIDSTIEHVSTWRQLAEEWDVPKTLINEIQENLRLDI